MADSLMNPRSHFHARSNSLPTKPHPVVAQCEEHLCRLRESRATSLSSSLAIGQTLGRLQDLQDCVEELLLLPLTQQALVQGRNQSQKLVDEVLDGSLRLLDVCNTIKDALSSTKEEIYELGSVIRRRQSGLDGEIRKYKASRKMVKKTTQKALKNLNLKGGYSKSTLSSGNEDPEFAEIFSTLRKVESVSSIVFDSLLSFICEMKSRSKPSHWSLVFKVMQREKVGCEGEETNSNEFAMADAALKSLIGCQASKLNSSMQMEDVQKRLNNLESCIQDLEEGTECLYRRMIKTRASFLNIFC